MSASPHRLTGAESAPAHFETTHWSVVCAAAGHDSSRAEAALNQLCRTYWYPLYAFIRRRGHDVPDAQDLTQAFLARLLEKKDLDKVGREKGRFRSFLLVALNHFLINEWHRTNREKRGGGREIIPLDQVLAENRYGLEPADQLTAEMIYERRWALTLLEQVLARLRDEYHKAGKLAHFEMLKGFLSADKSGLTYAKIGADLAMSEGAVRVAVCRLRQRYLECLRAEIANTVSSPSEIEDELRHLRAVLAG